MYTWRLWLSLDPKGREAHFQDFAYVLVLKGVGSSEELLVQKEKKYSLGTLSLGTLLYTIPYQVCVISIIQETLSIEVYCYTTKL